MGTLRDLTTQRFGRLVVLKRHGSTPAKQATWLCQCECGNQRIIRYQNLILGHTTSCGCFHKELVTQQSTTHGMSKTRVYKVWASMIQRCVNTNDKNYFNYGGRGIYVCPEWMDFATFQRDMGDRPPGTTVERENNNGPYAKWNCVWATQKEQSNNTRSNKTFMVDGRRLTAGQLADLSGVNIGTIRTRINRLGWTVERAMAEPAGPNYNHGNRRPNV